MAAENLARAFASTRSVLANVKADQLDDPTPCASWKVRDLLNHVIGGAHWFGEAAEAGVGTQPDAKDWTGGDLLAAYDEGARRSIAAFDAPGVQEKIIKLPFGEFPGSAFMMLATNDVFAHGWDLARALGQPTDLDPALAEELLPVAAAMVPDDVRGAEPMPFGPKTEAPEGATAADKLAALLGRNV